MSRRDNVEARCGLCRMHRLLCVCDLIPRLETRTRVVLVIHRIETRKPTNSGLLAARCLPNSEVLVRGVPGEPEPRFTADPERPLLLLFPGEGAIPIGDVAGPVTLIVPDGTWRQAAKVSHRLPGAAGATCVTLPPDAPTVYQLRAELHAGRLSTLEAIARALGVLDGPHVRRELEHIFRVMVDRTLWMRGSLRAEEVTGGIPAAALADDPRGGPTARNRRASQ